MRSKIIAMILLFAIIFSGFNFYLKKISYAKPIKKQTVDLNIITGKNQQNFKLIKNKKYDLTKFKRFKLIMHNTKYYSFDCFVNIKTNKKISVKKIKLKNDMQLLAKYKIKKKYKNKHFKIVVMTDKDKAIVLNSKINTEISKDLREIKLKKYGFDFLGFSTKENSNQIYYTKAPILSNMFLYPIFKQASLKPLKIKKTVKDNNCKFYINENPRIIRYIVVKKIGKKTDKFIFKNNEKLKCLEHKKFQEYIIKTKKIKIKGAIKIIKVYYKVKYTIQAEYTEKGKTKILEKKF